MAGGRAGSPWGGRWGRQDGYKVRGEKRQAGAHGKVLEPVSALTASSLEVGVLQEKPAGGLSHRAEHRPGPGV